MYYHLAHSIDVSNTNLLFLHPELQTLGLWIPDEAQQASYIYGSQDNEKNIQWPSFIKKRKEQSLF